MVNRDLQNKLQSTLKQRFHKPVLQEASQIKQSAKAAPFIQLIGQEGSGTRRYCFNWMKAHSRCIWISRQWKMYAPLLWKIAQEHQIELLGLEQSNPKRDRILWNELYQSQAFDYWVFDYLNMQNKDLQFLSQLLRRASEKLIILEPKALSLCQERVHFQLQHHQYLMRWSKGGAHQHQYFDSPYLQVMREDACLL